MTILEKTEFKNSHGDKVDVRLLQFGDEYQIIVGIEMHRRTTEKRFKGMAIVELDVYKFTHETEIIKTTVERTALVEFNLRRALNGDPELTMANFQIWLSATDKE